jgi:protein associated with RNAse G/E
MKNHALQSLYSSHPNTHPYCEAQTYKLQTAKYHIHRVTKKVGVLKASEMVTVDAHHHIALTIWADHRSWSMRNIHFLLLAL